MVPKTGLGFTLFLFTMGRRQCYSLSREISGTVADKGLKVSEEKTIFAASIRPHENPLLPFTAPHPDLHPGCHSFSFPGFVSPEGNRAAESVAGGHPQVQGTSLYRSF